MFSQTWTGKESVVNDGRWFEELYVTIGAEQKIHEARTLQRPLLDTQSLRKAYAKLWNWMVLITEASYKNTNRKVRGQSPNLNTLAYPLASANIRDAYELSFFSWKQSEKNYVMSRCSFLAQHCFLNDHDTYQYMYVYIYIHRFTHRNLHYVQTFFFAFHLDLKLRNWIYTSFIVPYIYIYMYIHIFVYIYIYI